MSPLYLRSQYRRPRSSRSGWVFPVLVLLVCAVVFILGVRWFRSRPVEPTTPGSAVAVVSEPPTSSASTDASVEATAALRDVSGGAATGTVSRGMKDERFTVEILVSAPPIDPATESYEAWLLRRFPFDYISIGPVAPREDGTFFLLWQALPGASFADYQEVIVTRELLDGDVLPGTHIFEGEFQSS